MGVKSHGDTGNNCDNDDSADDHQNSPCGTHVNGDPIQGSTTASRWPGAEYDTLTAMGAGLERGHCRTGGVGLIP